MLPAVVVVVVVLLPVVLELMALDGNDERSERLPLSLPGGGRTNPRTGLCTRRSSRSRAATHDLMVVVRRSPVLLASSTTLKRKQKTTLRYLIFSDIYC